MTDEAEDRFFDVLLGEATGGAAPPDLSPKILANLASRASETTGRPSPRTASRGTPVWLLFVLAAVLLISLGSYFWQSNGNPAAPDGSAVEIAKLETATTDSVTLPPQTSSSEAPAEMPKQASSGSNISPERDVVEPVQGSRGFGIGMDDLPFGQPAVSAPGTDASDSQIAVVSEPLDGDEIVRRLNGLIESGWQSMGIQPQEEVVAEELAGRFASIVFGRSSVETTDTQLAKRMLGDRSDEQTLAYVRDASAATNLGNRWASYLLGHSAWERLSDPQRRALGELVTACFDGRLRYDSLAMRMLTAEGATTPGEPEFNPDTLWMAGLAGEQSIPLTNQLCDVMLDLDGTCARCHHHPLERDIAQADYWGLNAIFQTGLRWQLGRKGHLRIATPSGQSRSDDVVFYDSPDRRQLVASPKVPTGWLENEAVKQPPKDLPQLAQDLIQGDRFARATVNGLWSLVYGNRLVGRTSDPLAPPRNEFFTAARDLLADQLRAHRYDLGAATAWMIAARPMRVSAAIDHFDADSLVSTDDELNAAELQQRSFAAYVSPLHDLTFHELVAVAEKFNGAAGNRSLLAPSVLLAQTAAEPVAGGQGIAAKSQQQLRNEALVRSLANGAAANESPAGWLESLRGGFVQKAQHLLYVAGVDRPSEKQLESAKRIRESANNDAIALQQLWWAIRLSKGSP